MIDFSELSYKQVRDLLDAARKELQSRYKGPEPVRHQSTIDELTRHC